MPEAARSEFFEQAGTPLPPILIQNIRDGFPTLFHAAVSDTEIVGAICMVPPMDIVQHLHASGNSHVAADAMHHVLAIEQRGSCDT